MLLVQLQQLVADKRVAILVEGLLLNPIQVIVYLVFIIVFLSQGLRVFTFLFRFRNIFGKLHSFFSGRDLLALVFSNLSLERRLGDIL